MEEKYFAGVEDLSTLSGSELKNLQMELVGSHLWEEVESELRTRTADQIGPPIEQK
ncbi:hypothetical protein [Halobacterium jilantaiense]|uniref:hypothetical protein n=1 Tax=Halobacterium jilantaiense TaxID=355548 RepID=UPI0015A6B649|nr:hypothetical protein [Halobacterium jilantaiense]